MSNFLVGLVLVLSISVFADNELTVAMFDNAEKISEMKKECGTILRNFHSEEVKPSVFEHVLGISRGSVMNSKPSCSLVIVQDYNPLAYDRPIEYKTHVFKKID